MDGLFLGEMYWLIAAVCYLFGAGLAIAAGTQKGWSLFACVAFLFVGAWGYSWISTAPFLYSPDDNKAPPIEFRAAERAEIVFVGAPKAGLHCGVLAVACYSRLTNKIYIANPCLQQYRHEDYALLLCHELAHTVGWDHKEGVSIEAFRAGDDKPILSTDKL